MDITPRISFIALLLLLVGCTYTTTVREYSEGSLLREAVVEQPKNTHRPSQIRWTTKPDNSSVTEIIGPSQEVPSYAMKAMSAYANWIGIGLILLGVAGVVLHFWIPIVPLTASLIVSGVGVAVWSFPYLLEQYAGYLIFGAAILVVLFFVGAFDNIWINKRAKPRPANTERSYLDEHRT